MDDDGRALGDGGHARAGGGAGRAQIDGGFRRRVVREAIRDAAGFGRVCRHLLGVLLEDIADLPVIGDAEEIAACARDGQNRSLRDTGDDVALRRRGAAAQVGIRIHGRAVRIACPRRQREGGQAAQQTAERQQAAQESACGRFGHEPVPPESNTNSHLNHVIRTASFPPRLCFVPLARTSSTPRFTQLCRNEKSAMLDAVF